MSLHLIQLFFLILDLTLNRIKQGTFCRIKELIVKHKIGAFENYLQLHLDSIPIMKNKANLYRIETVLKDTIILPPILYSSAPISSDIKVASYIALIENLFFSSSIDEIEVIIKEAEGHLAYCPGDQVTNRACNSFIDSLAALLNVLKDQNNPADSAVLKEAFYKNIESYNPYLKWIFSSKSPEDIFGLLSSKFGKDFELYQVNAGRLELSAQYKSPSILQKVEIRRILILAEYKNRNAILYEYTPYQLDELMRLCHTANQSLMSVKTMHDQTSESLESALLEKQQFVVRAGELEVTNKQLEAERMRLAGLLSTSDGNANQLRLQLGRLEDEKRRLEQQLMIEKRRSEDMSKREWEVKRNFEENQRRERDHLRQLRNQVDELRDQNRRLKEEARQNSYRQNHAPGRYTAVYDVPEGNEYEETYHSHSSMKVQQMEVEPAVAAQPPPHQPMKKKSKPFDPSFLAAIMGNSEEADKSKRTCSVCLMPKIPYRLFTCSHDICDECLTQTLKVKIEEGGNPTCPAENCKAELERDKFAGFLSNINQSGLLKQYNQIQIRKETVQLGEEKLVTCPKCITPFYIVKTQSTFNHCGVTICVKCQEVHPPNLSCDKGRALTMIELLERPCVCPQCLQLFDKNDACEHVTCQSCKPKKTQEKGFCPLCSVLRDPLLAHDTSYHRTDCRFYSPSPQAVQYLPNKCSECKRLGAACPRPVETFEQFILRQYGAEFNQKIKAIRKRNPIDKKL